MGWHILVPFSSPAGTAHHTHIPCLYTNPLFIHHDRQELILKQEVLTAPFVTYISSCLYMVTGQPSALASWLYSEEKQMHNLQPEVVLQMGARHPPKLGSCPPTDTQTEGLYFPRCLHFGKVALRSLRKCLSSETSRRQI